MFEFLKKTLNKFTTKIKDTISKKIQEEKKETTEEQEQKTE